MAPVDRLTLEQEAQLAEVRDEWQAAALATGPAERLRAEQGIRSAYRAAGLPAPSVCIWARSPLEAVLGAGHLAAKGGSRLAVALEMTYLELAGRNQGSGGVSGHLSSPPTMTNSAGSWPEDSASIRARSRPESTASGISPGGRCVR